MLSFLAALGSAIEYGFGDFWGGVASRRASAITVSMISSGLALPIIALVTFATPHENPGLADIAWGIAAGIGGAGGFGFYYAALAKGMMGIVAPVTAATTAAIPVVAAIGLGERPGFIAYVGFLLAVIAIVLVSLPRKPVEGGTQHSLAPIALGVFSGICASGFLICLSRAGHATGQWPFLMSRLTTTAVLLTVIAVMRRPLGLPRPALQPTLGAAALGTAGSMSFLFAAQHGLLSISAVVSSLNPAVICILAVIFLHERLDRLRTGGVILALLSVGAIAAATQ